METLLIHEELMNGPFFADICNLFKREGVKLNSGPKLNQLLTFGPPVSPYISIFHSHNSQTIYHTLQSTHLSDFILFSNTIFAIN